jgi:hypothetical protein
LAQKIRNVDSTFVYEGKFLENSSTFASVSGPVYVIPKVVQPITDLEITPEIPFSIELKRMNPGITTNPWESTASHMGDVKNITSYHSYLIFVNKYESNPGFFIDASRPLDEISSRRGNFQLEENLTYSFVKYC